MKHAFCGLIHNFTCMNSNFVFHVSGTHRGQFLRPLSNKTTVFAGASFHVFFTCGDQKKFSWPASQSARQAGRPGQPARPASKAASQPAQSVQPASQQASQPAQLATQPASQTTSPASPTGRLPEASKKLYTDSIMCSTCV